MKISNIRRWLLLVAAVLSVAGAIFTLIALVVGIVTDCFWASKADSLYIACDWDHDGILKNDADLVSQDAIAAASRPSHVINSGKEGTKLGIIKVGDVEALALINSDDNTVLKAIAKPGSLDDSQKAVASE